MKIDRSFIIVGFIACLTVASPGMVAGQMGQSEFDKRVKVDVVRSRKVRPLNYFEKADSVSLLVRFTNTDTQRSFDGLSATLYLFAQNAADRTEWKFLGQASSALSLPPRGRHEFESADVRLEYDDRGSVKYGYRFDCWILVVKDGTGAILSTKSSPPRFAGLEGKLPGLKEGERYNEKLEPIKKTVY